MLGSSPFRRAACTALLGAVLVPAAPAAADVDRCRSGDMRYAFAEGRPEHFGVFRLKADGPSCATARRVAKAWMDRFEAGLDDGRVRLEGRVAGYRFTELQPTRAQTYRLRGRKGGSTVRFDYVVPNG